MRIGIDARLINETGVGRYIRNLLTELAKIDRTNTYVVFVRKAADFEPPNGRWIRRVADIRWHTIAEQIRMPAIFSKEHLDLLHVPYFNVPLFYFGRFIVTIHDLTILHFDTGKATTLPYIIYKMKRLFYYLVLMKAMHWSEKIIAVSHATRKEILDHFDVLPEHVEVIYEG